jgi:3'-phosphoadenosine 5'-phosphosulfate sulfotransferase (PAPS reductase)/FAD synthetase
MNIVSFSGGKDSTAMLLMMLEKGIQVDRVICVDTTKEFPQMYEHIKKVQAMIEPLKIEIVKIDFDYWFSEHVKTRGKIGEVGYGWPNIFNRWCTALKREAKRRFKSKDDVDFLGIAFDEKERTLKNKTGEIFRYPLVEWEITERQALDYCYSKGLDWGGLYEKMHRVSCWCCPLSRIGGLRVLHNDFPELWKELEEMDKKTFRKFRRDYSVADLSEKFVNENREICSKTR